MQQIVLTIFFGNNTLKRASTLILENKKDDD